MIQNWTSVLVLLSKQNHKWIKCRRRTKRIRFNCNASWKIQNDCKSKRFKNQEKVRRVHWSKYWSLKGKLQKVRLIQMLTKKVLVLSVPNSTYARISRLRCWATQQTIINNLQVLKLIQIKKNKLNKDSNLLRKTT